MKKKKWRFVLSPREVQDPKSIAQALVYRHDGSASISGSGLFLISL